jgi:hypothetical protein
LPSRESEDSRKIDGLKLGFAFVAGVATGVGGCLFLYFISSLHPLSGRPHGISDREHSEPFQIGGSTGVGTGSDSAADATLSLLPIALEEQPDEQSIKHFSLHIPIKTRPDTHINVRDVVVHVLFYDLVGGQTVVQTSGNVKARWVNPPADWIKSDTEELAVEYDLPKPGAGATRREIRKYYGYLVRVYYRNQLQAAIAEPERLRRQYPAPPILPK